MIPRPSRTLVAAALAAATALATLCLAPPASSAPLPAPPPQGVKMQKPEESSYGQAHVVNDVAAHPTQQWYEAGPGSNNSTGLTNYAVRTGTGQYRVWLPGIGSHGAAVITAAAEAYCTVGDIVEVTDRDVPGSDVVVSCFHDLGLTLTGGPAPAGTSATGADTTFTLDYSYLAITDLTLPPGHGEPSAYLRATRPADRSYVPDLGYQYNVTGEPNVVDRTDTGDYLVGLPGLERLVGGRANVTGYGPGSHRCETGRQVGSATMLVIQVRCLTADGAPADAPFVFTLVYPAAANRAIAVASCSAASSCRK